jgi:hypothetical protein
VWRSRARFRVPRQRALHAIEQFLVAERFLQEIECAVLHGFHGHRDVAVPVMKITGIVAPRS